MFGADARQTLSIEGLTIAYRQDGSWIDAVRDFQLNLESGKTYGLVGESGSGKTTVALAIMRHLGEEGLVRDGRIEFVGQDLLKLDTAALEDIWGSQLTLVPQDPLSSLNPSISIGEQLAETLRHHFTLSRSEADEKALELLAAVRVPDPARVFRSYPHQTSGGMQQRVMIAMALSTEPKLLILDEPTTALDVTTQAVILDLFRELMHQHDTAALYVTHNLGVVARICDRVAVLYASELVEDASIHDLFNQPLHPYTVGLIDSIPKPGDNKRLASLRAIPGQIPSLADRPSGCVFAPRCPLAIDLCHEERPALEAIDEFRSVRCHRWPEIVSGAISTSVPVQAPIEPHIEPGDAGAEAVLEVEDLHVTFALRRSLFQLLSRTPAEQVKAVSGLSLTISRSKTLGLVGESGSGKTSLARAVIGLEKATESGEIALVGETVYLSSSLAEARS